MPDPGVAVVTGAASGLGAAIANLFRERGWIVAGIDLRGAATDLHLVADVADLAAVDAAVATVVARLGHVDALVTVAGVYEMLPIAQITDERWNRMLSINVAGTVNAISAVLPGMIANETGSIVTISSDLGVGGSQGDAHYAATKGAIIGLSRSLALELAGTGVTVNSVAPGAADTAMLAADSPWREAGFLETLPVTRLVSPDEIAAAVLFFVEAGAGFSGQVLSPNSGATI